MDEDETDEEGGADSTRESSPYFLWSPIPSRSPSSVEESSMRSTLSFFKSTNNTSILRLYIEEEIFGIRKEKRK